MCPFLFGIFVRLFPTGQKKKTSPGFFALPPKATAFCTKVVKAVLCKSSGTFGKERMFFLVGRKHYFTFGLLPSERENWC